MAEKPETTWADFKGLNAAYLLDLYDRYAQDPESVDPETRELFQKLGPPEQAAPSLPAGPVEPSQADNVCATLAACAAALALAIRAHGHRAAWLDPLGEVPPR
jgi:2-oxoglutarate dehydrogenase E1 component